MKRIVFVLVLTVAAMVATAQNTPKGVRMESTELTVDNKEYSTFCYKTDDGTLQYYLGLGSADAIVGTIVVFDEITETCIYLGATSEEAIATMDTIVALFDRDRGATRQFKACIAVANKLSEPDDATCVVKKRLFGKRLSFFCKHKSYTTETYLTKSAAKQLRWGLKVDKKLHPNRH